MSSFSRYATFDRAPPPIFRQGPSALSKLFFFWALAIFFIVADARFQVAKPIRSLLITALYPLQWLAMQPLIGVQAFRTNLQSLHAAQSDTEDFRRRLLLQLQKASAGDQLMIENQRLRQLLDLKSRPDTSGIAAEVIYEAADPFTRKLVINKGEVHNLVAGSPVLDDLGVLGQITRTYPVTSEVTLIVDRNLAIPVLNTRTGERSVAYGNSLSHSGMLELRFMAANADVLQGDLLTTSGVDGVYPAGLPVAKIDKIERRADTAFAKIHCLPLARTSGASHVMVLSPLTNLPTNPLMEQPTPKIQRKQAARP